MIYEFRTYRLKVGSLPEVLKRFGEAYQHRKKLSELAAFWYTEIGPLNEVVHVWPYKDVAERSRIRGEAVKDPNWPPKIGEFLLDLQSEIVIPYSFSPALSPAKLGPVYEMRYYTYRAGVLPEIMKRWEAKLPERLKLSPLAFAGYTDLGALNKHIHIWPYASLNDRAAIRSKATEIGAWPPPGGADLWLQMNNKILLPSAFSPLQ
jgi:hypothetical protein